MPASGASTAPAVNIATIGASGQARVSVVANGVAGCYIVSATASGAIMPASFGLTNQPASAVRMLVLFTSTDERPRRRSTGSRLDACRVPAGIEDPRPLRFLRSVLV
jgi:hypothetical protein